MIHILGDQKDPESPLELSFRLEDVQIDLFLMRTLNATHEYFQVFKLSEPVQRYKAVFPRVTELCASDMHGFLVYVPCNVEEVLEVGFFTGMTLLFVSF